MVANESIDAILAAGREKAALVRGMRTALVPTECFALLFVQRQLHFYFAPGADLEATADPAKTFRLLARARLSADFAVKSLAHRRLEDDLFGGGQQLRIHDIRQVCSFLGHVLYRRRRPELLL